MRKIALLAVVSLMLLSCKKENDMLFPKIPDWLSDKIARMDTSGYYFGTAVYLYKWHDEYFYLISIPLSSCIMCEFYTYQGVKFIWTDDNSEDFRKNAIRKKIVWQRDPI